MGNIFDYLGQNTVSVTFTTLVSLVLLFFTGKVLNMSRERFMSARQDKNSYAYWDDRLFHRDILVFGSLVFVELAAVLVLVWKIYLEGLLK